MSTERVFVTERVVSMLRQSAEAARPLETGGVLVGVLRDDTPWITAAVEVIDQSRTSASFVIPYGVTPIAVEAAQQHDHRVGFIGMWHSHPANLEASPTDKATLRRNARRRERQKAVPVVLIVVRGNGTDWDLDVLGDKGLGPMPAELVLTGPLGPDEAADAG